LRVFGCVAGGVPFRMLVWLGGGIRVLYCGFLLRALLYMTLISWANLITWLFYLPLSLWRSSGKVDGGVGPTYRWRIFKLHN